MKFIKNISWEKVFANWKERESNNPSWIKCALEK